MTEVCNFVAVLTRAGKSQKEIQPLMDAAHGDKILSLSQKNWIIKAVKEWKNTSDKRPPAGRKRSGLVTSWCLSLPP
jgi:hypothetical protein